MTQTKPDPPSTHAIKSLIQAFFDSINAADTVALGSHFVPNATLTILRQDPPRAPDDDEASSSSSSSANERESGNNAEKDKESIKPILRTTIEAFIALLDAGKKKRENSPKPQPVIHETPDLHATRVDVDGLFGAAWSPFRVTFDGVLHHYGILAFTLGKEEEGGEWRIEGLTQSYRWTVGWEAESEFF